MGEITEKLKESKTGRFKRKFSDVEIGDSFSRWVAVGTTYKAENSNNRYCLCRCSCGTTRPVLIVELQKGTSKSCGCTRGKSNLKPFESGYKLLLRQAKKRDYVVSLSYNEYLEFTKIGCCHYCNSDIDWVPYNIIKNHSCAHHLDRKDNGDGYSKENCVVCCARCNWGKGRYFTYDEWMQLGQVIKSWK